MGIGSYRRDLKIARWAVCAQVKEPPAEGTFWILLDPFGFVVHVCIILLMLAVGDQKKTRTLCSQFCWIWLASFP